MAIMFPDENRVVCPDCHSKLFEVKQVCSLLHNTADSYVADTGMYVITCADCGREIDRLAAESIFRAWPDK